MEIKQDITDYQAIKRVVNRLFQSKDQLFYFISQLETNYSKKYKEFLSTTCKYIKRNRQLSLLSLYEPYKDSTGIHQLEKY